MDKKNIIILKSVLIALSAGFSAFSSGMLLNYLLRGVSAILFLIFFLIASILLFELYFLFFSILLGKIHYFYSLNNRIMNIFKKNDFKSELDISENEKERLKNIIDVKTKNGE